MTDQEIVATPERGTIQALDLTEPMRVAAALGKEGVEVLERLHAIRREELVMEKEAAFSAAMADLHGRMGSVKKNQEANITTKDGRRMTYRYADKHAIASALRAAGSADFGLSWSWDYDDTERGIKVTCWARHRGGHRESSTWSSEHDGRNNPLTSNSQKKKIITTTAERVTLAAVFGVTDTEDDVDAPLLKGEGANVETVTPDQALEIEAKAEETGADWGKLLQWVSRREGHEVTSSDEIPARFHALLMEKFKAKASK